MAGTTVQSPRPSARESGFVESDRIQIYFEDYGNGTPIILVHGWGSSLHSNWVRTGWVDALLPVRRVVALDVRGHGASDKPHEQSLYSYEKMSRDVLRVIDHLGIPKADLMGYSMGSCIGASLLGSSRTRFRSMILGGIGDETDQSLAILPKIVAGLRAKDPTQIEDPLSLGYYNFASADPRNDLEALALSALQMWPEGFPLKLIGPIDEGLDHSVLVVNGADDHPYIDTVHELVSAIPNAKLVVIPERDHVSVVDDPRFKHAVLQFLDPSTTSGAPGLDPA